MLESNDQGKSRVLLNAVTSDNSGRRRRRVGISDFGLLATLILSGSASKPILSYESDVPAQVLSPIQVAGVKDGRARFREIFCQRFDLIGAPADGGPSCSDYLHRLADEPASNREPARPRVPLQSVRFVVVPGFQAKQGLRSAERRATAFRRSMRAMRAAPALPARRSTGPSRTGRCPR